MQPTRMGLYHRRRRAPSAVHRYRYAWPEPRASRVVGALGSQTGQALALPYCRGSGVHRQLRRTPAGDAVLKRAAGQGGVATCRDVTTGAERREERSGRSRSRGGGRCRFVEDAVRSDATPDRSRSCPAVCGGIAFPRQFCAARPLMVVVLAGGWLRSPGRSTSTLERVSTT